MIEYFDKKEFMKAPVELHSVTESYDVLGPRNNVIMPFVQEQSIVLHIGDHDYDVRDLVRRLLRAECDVVALMSTVADLKTQIEVLEEQMRDREAESNYNTKALDDFINGVWKDIGN